MLEKGNLDPSINNFQNYSGSFSEVEDKSTTSHYSLHNELLPWDAFTYFPLKKESASMQNKKWLDVSMHIIKVFVYGILFCIVFCSGLIAKLMLLLAVSQLDESKTIQLCDYFSEYEEQLGTKISRKGKITWTWNITFMFLIPECLTILHAIWYYLFKKKAKLPRGQSIAILFFMETLHPIGIALLIFYSFPRLNSVDAAAISSCVCFIPAVLNLLFHQRKSTSTTAIFLLVLVCNVLVLVAQASGVFLQAFLNYNAVDPITCILPLALILSSCRWWSNYVSHSNYSRVGFIKVLINIKMDLMYDCEILQGYVAFWRCFIFILSAILISLLKGINIQELLDFSWESEYNVELIERTNSFSGSDMLLSNFYLTYVDVVDTITDSSTPFYSFLVQAFCTLLLYKAAKFAYQTQMHQFGFALPISLVTPGAISLILILSVLREQDSCILHDIIPDYLFMNAYSYKNMAEFLLNWRIWCWIIWWLSQIWITFQVWLGENERIAPIEKIFYHFSYDPFMTDQFLGLNKRRHENGDHISKEEEGEEEHRNSITFETCSLRRSQTWNSSHLSISTRSDNNKKNSCITQIYACATMWHENKEEMSELIGSILRLDRDQCAMKVTQKYYKIHIKDYYELETHVIFDDAFCCMHGCIESCDHNEIEIHVNQYVITFLEAMQENIKNLGILNLPPIKCPTPYGGQLIWNLPGNTRLTVHLKDKNKIRHRKRWSQVMYMYYLLGYRLMGSSIDIDTKEIIAENTYILTLDGDVDFRPAAVKSLVDLMKKDKELGAACGRIHPIGKGLMLWFQKFEYAVGHWLQKSTEHTIGSVLCSPGCFSLFRAKALMQNNVIAKYATKSTEPRHYIQYDQGEDRWLCTLILQAGCKVEYCAASDAYTHAPESFEEFYIQRRRWIPSTIANIFDLLGSSKRIRRTNDNISWLYVIYQWILTGSTIIGPSFIYLMVVGAFVTCFQLDNWLSFWYNSIPIIIFIITCFLCKVRMQLIVAEILTVVYALVMMVALVGTVLQIAADGYFTPNALLFFTVICQFIIAAILHPQELSCLPNGFIYYITVPSMYMLLIIFSIFNVHNITWGTRESKSHKQILENNSQAEQNIKTTENKHKKFPLSNLFTCSFCTYTKSTEDEKYLESIYKSLTDINNRLKEIERYYIDKKELEYSREYATNNFTILFSNYNIKHLSEDNIEEKSNNQSTVNSKEEKLQVVDDSGTDSEVEAIEQKIYSDHQEYPNYLINPYWLQDKRLKNGKVDFLPISEEEFWKNLIEKYLHPIEYDNEKQQAIAEGLIHIRNECLLKFFMINTFFVITIFLLQINKDVLHLQWPFAVQYNITYADDYEVHIYRRYMHLEPIGCLFIVAFVLILFIQFIAMLVHRFTTFTHILANVTLFIPCFGKKQQSSDLISSKHAKNIAEELQNATEDNSIFNVHNYGLSPSGKRKTVRELVEDTQNSSNILPNFEIFFHKKLKDPSTSGFSRTISSTIPKNIMEALERRRSNMTTEHNKLKSQISVPNKSRKRLSKQHVYDNPTFLNSE